MNELKKLPDEIREALRNPLPQIALKKRPGGGNLSSINPYYVIERLNDVFGLGAWDIEWDIVESMSDSEAILVKGKIVLLNYPDCRIPATFGGMSQNYFSDGKPVHNREDMGKGSVTSLISKLASFLEIGIDIYKGLQSHDSEPKNKPESQPEIKIVRMKDEDSRFNFDLLKNGKWNGQFEGENFDLIYIRDKKGNLTGIQLTPMQKQACESFLVTELQKPKSQ